MNAPTIPVTENVADLDSGQGRGEVSPDDSMSRSAPLDSRDGAGSPETDGSDV
jgi:hypothetical protein